jgi:hypothetical protein
MCQVQRSGVTYTRVILGIEKYDEIGRIDVTVDVYMDVSCVMCTGNTSDLKKLLNEFISQILIKRLK